MGLGDNWVGTYDSYGLRHICEEPFAWDLALTDGWVLMRFGCDILIDCEIWRSHVLDVVLPTSDHQRSGRSGGKFHGCLCLEIQQVQDGVSFSSKVDSNIKSLS